MPRYAFYDYVRELPELLTAVHRLVKTFEATGRPVAAGLIASAYGTLERELAEMAIRVAAKATDILREQERKTRVRPDTGGGGGARLGDSLIAEPVGVGVLPGSVGVASMDELNKNVPWWITNEVGSTARVGGALYGFFEPGHFAPDPTQGRQHPLFAPVGSADGGHLMVINNPIPARRFIEKSVPIIDAAWQGEFAAVKGRFDAALSKALVTFR